jgi:AcrR family transcriptional regulator
MFQDEGLHLFSQRTQLRARCATAKLQAKVALIKEAKNSNNPDAVVGDERVTRILNAALEVFSESSYGKATTDEIARRARVSKRDLYSTFPNKNALMTAVIHRVLNDGDIIFAQSILDDETDPELRNELRKIGLALISELLSPAAGYLSRLIAAESFKQPQIGEIYFENWYARRSESISKVLSRRITNERNNGAGGCSLDEAAKQFIALVAHQPQLSVFVGMGHTWTTLLIENHVDTAVECFLRSLPQGG